MEVIGKFILNLIADGIATLIHDIFVALLTVIMDFVLLQLDSHGSICCRLYPDAL